MNKTSSFKPVGNKERIHVLDALRGFAIFGIFVINVRVFSGYVLILFKGLSDRGLLWAAFLLLLIPGLHAWYLLQSSDGNYTHMLYQQLSGSWMAADLPQASTEYETFQMRDVVEVIQSGSWSTVLSFNYLVPLLRG